MDLSSRIAFEFGEKNRKLVFDAVLVQFDETAHLFLKNGVVRVQFRVAHEILQILLPIALLVLLLLMGCDIYIEGIDTSFAKEGTDRILEY